VESARRTDVLRAIVDRFGAERVAAVAVPETYRVRHALRDVGAALGMDPVTVDRLARSFPHHHARDARAALAELPELRALCGREHSRLWELVEALDGLPRGVAVHPSGVLLSDATLLDRTPVVPAGGAVLPVSQFDKEDVEDLKLLKLDVLGGRMQSAMAYAVGEIGRATGERIDLDDLAQVPRDDPATYALIGSAETLGCFQIGSPGVRDLVGRLRPETFHDLVVDIPLVRPGPVAADMVRLLIEGRRRRAPGRRPHGDLEKVLHETCGVVVFHEQVARILDVMTGCGPAVADERRRALSDPERRGAVEAWFGDRARERGHSPEEIRRTWDVLGAYSGQGFSKAHAVALAVPTCQSAWLKAHRPAAFYAGLLTHDPGLYPKRLLLADARRRGVPVLPPDVNASDVDCRIELLAGKWGLRLGLGDVHGIGGGEAARLVSARPYGSLRDLWRRARPGRQTAERLARAGALDRFGGERRDLLRQIAELHQQEPAGGAEGGRLPLTGCGGSRAPGGPRQLTQDHHAFLAELGAVPARSLRGVRHGQTVLVAGAQGGTHAPPADSGRRAAFITLDDGAGLVDCAFFDDREADCADTVAHSLLLLVRGVVRRRGPQSVSVVGAAAWNLAELLELRRTGGLQAVAEHLAEPPEEGGQEGHESDVASTTGRRLWHSSPGSAG
jgi:error-prone DNA polymerase